MTVFRKWIRDIFGFSGTEINGFVVLIPLMAVLIFSEPLYRRWQAQEATDSQRDTFLCDSLAAAWSVPRDPVRPAAFSGEFDPNSAPEEAMEAAGVPRHLATRIAAYRSKGGKFRVKADLMKIYGLDSTLYKQLYDRVGLPAQLREDPSRARKFKTAVAGSSQRRRDPFDLNEADTTILKSIYGIGSKLAARIVKFRDALGGFVRFEQLYEVYGLDSSVVRNLRPRCFISHEFTPKTIDVNKAGEKELSAHPYVRYKLARLLVNYRFQHGDFRSVEDIKNVSAIKPEELERLLPYVKVEDPQ